MNGIEQLHGFFGLVRLQRADQMQFEARFEALVMRNEQRPFCLGLLDAGLTEYALPRTDHRLDCRRRECLRARDESDAGWITPGIAAGTRDLRAHQRKSVRLVHAVQSALDNLVTCALRVRSWTNRDIFETG